MRKVRTREGLPPMSDGAAEEIGSRISEADV